MTPADNWLPQQFRQADPVEINGQTWRAGSGYIIVQPFSRAPSWWQREVSGAPVLWLVVSASGCRMHAAKGDVVVLADFWTASRAKLADNVWSVAEHAIAAVRGSSLACAPSEVTP